MHGPSDPTKSRSPQRKPPKVEEFHYGPWTIKTVKSHIMACEEADLAGDLKLPHLPDMLFIHNRLRCDHASGFHLEFNPLDALKRVDAINDPIRVSNSQDWLEARKNSPHLNKIVHPFDWTYSTDYSGTITAQESLEEGEITDLQIDYEKLKVQEKILFFDEVVLYEDELDDNGCTKLSAKIRVMPSGFFILMRFYLRVDHTLIRIHDSRFYFEAERPYLLREYSEREAQLESLQLPAHLLTDQTAVVDHLPVKRTLLTKFSLAA